VCYRATIGTASSKQETRTGRATAAISGSDTYRVITACLNRTHLAGIAIAFRLTRRETGAISRSIDAETSIVRSTGTDTVSSRTTRPKGVTILSSTRVADASTILADARRTLCFEVSQNKRKDKESHREGAVPGSRKTHNYSDPLTDCR
jgi:hypothetical protein